MDREKAYSYFPILIQNILCTIEGWRIKRFRYNKTFYKLLREAENRTFKSYDEICTFRNCRLRDFIEWSYRTVPYYRNLFNKLGAHPDDFKAVEDLQKLPILTKAQVKNNLEEITSEKLPRSKMVIAHTSGSTGGGLRFATTQDSIQEQYAIWWRFFGWHGLKQDTWCGCFGGRSVVPLSQNNPPFWRYNYFGKQLLFSGYHMNQSNLGFYVAQLGQMRPPWLHGYPSLLALLASFLLDSGENLGYKIRWVTIGSENLRPQQAELIEKAFEVQPTQHYGLSEGVANICECSLGKFHVDEDFAAVEFVPNTNGLGYRVIGTNFTNLATPLIRYDTQDIVTLHKEDICPCGRPGRIVETIDGRKEDYVVLKNGTLIGRMDHIFKDLVNIREAQIYQKFPGEITIKIVKGGDYYENDENKLLFEMKKRVGEETKIDIQYVNQLERTKSGKLRFVISEIEDGKIE